MILRIVLTVILVVAIIALIISRQPDPSVDDSVFRTRFSAALIENGFLPNVRLEPFGEDDTPFNSKEAHLHVPFKISWNPNRWYPHTFSKCDWNYRVAVRGSKYTVVCSIVSLDGRVSFIQIEAQANAMSVAKSLHSLFEHEFPVLMTQIQPSRSFRAGDAQPIFVPEPAESAALNIQKYLRKR